MPRDQAIAQIKEETERTYARKGKDIVRKNFEAIDAALANLHPVTVPAAITSRRTRQDPVPESAPRVRAPGDRGDAGPARRQLAGERPPGRRDLPDRDGPLREAKHRRGSSAVGAGFVHPVRTVRGGLPPQRHPGQGLRPEPAAGGSGAFPGGTGQRPGLPEARYTLQIYVEDCTGWGLRENCPAHSPEDFQKRAINMRPRLEQLDRGRAEIGFFETLPWADRARVNAANVRGVQFLEPLFEFSGACAGCGETPYLKMLSQLFGERLQIANATGCSSIYGGNLPTTPWTTNAAGRGPAWSNSLFEDNAEFGLGYRLAIDQQTELAHALARKLAPPIGEALVKATLEAPQLTESDFRIQRDRVAALKERLAGLDIPEAKNLLAVADCLVRRSVWLVGGDGWAYDIGSGGLDHVLSLGEGGQGPGARHRGLLQHRGPGLEGHAAAVRRRSSRWEGRSRRGRTWG